MQTFLKVCLPWSLPHLFSALKVSVTLSVIGAVIGEFVGSKEGLGFIILINTTYMRTAVVFAVIFILAAIGITLFMIVSLLEKILTPWAVSEKR
jgi:NitT/TauT family transport system permease protein